MKQGDFFLEGYSGVVRSFGFDLLHLPSALRFSLLRLSRHSLKGIPMCFCTVVPSTLLPHCMSYEADEELCGIVIDVVTTTLKLMCLTCKFDLINEARSSTHLVSILWVNNNKHQYMYCLHYGSLIYIKAKIKKGGGLIILGIGRT